MLMNAAVTAPVANFAADVRAGLDGERGVGHLAVRDGVPYRIREFVAQYVLEIIIPAAR